MMTEELRNKIIEEVEKLKDIDDCVGIKLNNDKGLFIQVVNDYSIINDYQIEEKEYLVELNDIDEDNCWYPCEYTGYNGLFRFGDVENLIQAIEEHYKPLNI